MKKIITLICIFISTFSFSQEINLVEVASGFSSPVDIANAGDERLFVVERRGRIKVINADGTVRDELFLNIDDIVRNVSGQGEQGLLGLAFHPNYTENGFFFVNYTGNDGNTIVERYSVTDDENIADPTTGKMIIQVYQPAANHNGGCIQFGPDGYLYIGMGDGGSADDPWNNSQNRQELLGKMLRIDIDTDEPYLIPEDNPFASDDFTLDEIWAIGLRNPWRFSFDSETGDLWIADVGQNQIEEIDFQSANSDGGENYGWRCYEGNRFTNNDAQNECPTDTVPPVFEVEQNFPNGPCSVTGGYVYRGTQSLDLVGKYIFADYCNGEFFSVEPNGTGGWNGNSILDSEHNISTFGLGSDGELYIASFFEGSILRVESTLVNTNEIATEISDVSISPNPMSSTFNLSFATTTRTNLMIEILSLEGKTVYSNAAEVNGEYSQSIELGNEPIGTYLLRIRTSTGVVTRRILKSN